MGSSVTLSESVAQSSRGQLPAYVVKGDDSTSAEELAQMRCQALRKQVLADLIPIQNMAEIVSLSFLSCVLPLVYAKLVSVERAMLLLWLYVSVVVACELFTDISIVVL